MLRGTVGEKLEEPRTDVKKKKVTQGECRGEALRRVAVEVAFSINFYRLR